MAGCCRSRGCDEFFDARFARKAASRYRRRGLDRTARRIVGFLERQGIAGATVLEIGGGVGEIQLELLKRGAARTVNLELSGGYDEQANELLREAGLAGRAERRLLDIAEAPAEVEPADVVVLNRVVCCYPDYERLLTAAADHARRSVVFSYPPRNPISRLAVTLTNALLRLRGREFRTFTHAPRSMFVVLERRGLRPAFARRAVVWQVAGLERPPGDPLPSST